IRIISLSPGFWDDDISCTTHVVSLDHAPVFSALSYTWGNPNPTEVIFLDGEEFHAMENLTQALRHLRQQEEVRILWIDFLCIDQANNDEKSWQVNMMGRIYQACEKVFLWLG
ncbi:HET-domain-containing protein, partial [Lophium mytilinum]